MARIQPAANRKRRLVIPRIRERLRVPAHLACAAAVILGCSAPIPSPSPGCARLAADDRHTVNLRHSSVGVPDSWNVDVDEGPFSTFLRAMSPSEAASLTVLDSVSPDVGPDQLPNTSEMSSRGTDSVRLSGGQEARADVLMGPGQYGYRVVIGSVGAAAEIVLLAPGETCDEDLRSILGSIAYGSGL